MVLGAVVIALIGATAAFVIACGSSGSDNGGSDATVDTIKIGTLYPVTGESAVMGQECVAGAELAVKEINAAGGIKAMGGAKIELVKADSQGSSDVGASEVKRLVQQDQVAAIIGTYNSSVAETATQTAQRLQMPFLISMAVADDITQKGYDYVFRICPTSSLYAKTQLEFCKALAELCPTYKYLPIKRIALLHEDSDFGQGTAAAQKKYIKEYGFTLASEVVYPSSSQDLTTQVSKIKASNPDIILTSTYLNDSILIMQAKLALGMDQLLFDAAGGTGEADFVKRLGDKAENVVGESEFNELGGDVAEELNAIYEKAYGEVIGSNAAYAYQAVYLLAKVLEQTKTTDPSKLRDAIAGVKMDINSGDRVVVPYNPIEFGEDGQAIGVSLFVNQIQGAVAKPVFPADYATADVQP